MFKVVQLTGDGLFEVGTMPDPRNGSVQDLLDIGPVTLRFHRAEGDQHINRHGRRQMLMGEDVIMVIKGKDADVDMLPNFERLARPSELIEAWKARK